MRYYFESADIEKIIENVVDGFSPVVNANVERIKLRTDGNKNYEAYVDIGKIRQVIVNLIDNAIKYSKEGDIKINLYNKSDEGNILISISDDGIGIPKSFLKRAFDKFTRGENGVKLHANGSGIGLYIAKEIVKSHKGRIWAQSDGDGKGSVFFVELPISPQALNS